MRLKLFFALLTITGLLLTSCQEDPTSLGNDLIDNPIKIYILDSRDDNINQNSGSYVADSLNFGPASRVLLGQFDNITSTMLMRYGILIPDSIAASLEKDSIQINSAYLNLYPIYEIGQTDGSIDFSIHNITSKWGSKKFSSDSLALLNYDQTDVSGDKNFTDSLITVDVSKDLILQWMKDLAATDGPPVYGLLFKPSPASRKIIGFRGYNSMLQNDSPMLKIIVEKPGSFTDTISAPALFDVHVVEGNIPQPPQNEILLEAGLGGRGSLFFDLSSLPAQANILKATLTVTADSIQTVFGKPQPDSIRVNLFSDSTNYSFSKEAPRSYLKNQGDYTFSGDISRIVQKIVLETDNEGFGLSLSSEISGLDKVYIFGSNNSDLNLRPKLIIYYSKLEL